MNLGHWYRDVITGFLGVCVGSVQYLTGCNQALLQPCSEDNSKKPEPEWFDIQRLRRVEDLEPIALENGANPGADKPAPRC